MLLFIKSRRRGIFFWQVVLHYFLKPTSISMTVQLFQSLAGLKTRSPKNVLRDIVHLILKRACSYVHL